MRRTLREEHRYKQAKRGRPGPHTAYRKITRRRYDIEWSLDQDAIAYDQKSDGMYPLLSNDTTCPQLRSFRPTRASPPSRNASSRSKPCTRLPPSS